MPRRRIQWATLVVAALVLTPLLQVRAESASYPSRPIRLLVGSPPGSPSDLTARLFAEELARQFRRPVTVENRAGAANSLAAGIVAKASPDGYTLAVVPDTVTKVTPLLDRPLDFNVRTDLVPVSVLALFSQVLVCSRSVGVHSVPDLVRRARDRPLIYASGGVGSPGHLATEMFLLHAGAKMKHVPYRGPTPAAAAVVSDEVDCGFLAATAVLPLVNTGQLRALAVSSATPSSLVADVPTLAKSLDQPNLDISFRLLLLAPKDTPAAVLTVLERAATEIMKKPAVRKQLQALALTAQGSTMKEATALMQAEIVQWEALVKRLNLKRE